MQELTNIKTYGDEKVSCLVVETVGTFINMMNYINSNNSIIRYTDGGIESIPPSFNFEESKEYILIFNQTLKILIDGKEVSKTKDNFNKILNIHKNIFSQALNDTLKASEGVGFLLSKI